MSHAAPVVCRPKVGMRFKYQAATSGLPAGDSSPCMSSQSLLSDPTGLMID
jgi:hypothetical protein